MNHQFPIRPVRCSGIGVNDFVVAIEVHHRYREEVLRCMFEGLSQPAELPLGDEFVTVEMKTPVPAALASRFVLQHVVPSQAVRFCPPVPEDADSWIDLVDSLEG